LLDPPKTPWRADPDLSQESHPYLLGPGVSALDGSASPYATWREGLQHYGEPGSPKEVAVPSE